MFFTLHIFPVSGNHASLYLNNAVLILNSLFLQAYGRELLEARECCLKYRKTGKDAELTQVFHLPY